MIYIKTGGMHSITREDHKQVMPLAGDAIHEQVMRVRTLCKVSARHRFASVDSF
jgi:hypothetical protein